MSNARFCIIPARALGDKNLARNDIMVLNALGLFGDRNGWCWPSLVRIAEMIGAHKVSVSKSVSKLVECGYVESRPRYREDGGQTSNEYRILFDAPTSQATFDLGTGEEDDGTPLAATPTPLSETANPPIASEAKGGLAAPLTLYKEPILTPQSIPSDDEGAGEVQRIFQWLEAHFNSPSIFYITAPIHAWLAWGADFEKDIKPVAIAYLQRRKKPPRSLAWLDEAIEASIKQRTKPRPESESHADTNPGYAQGNSGLPVPARKGKPTAFDNLVAGSLAASAARNPDLG